MLGRAAVAMWWDIAPEMREEFEDWHTHEHMPERLRIPGFLRGTRWIAQDGALSYFILYEAARPSTLTAGPYLDRLNDPTPWSRKMMPHHRNMARSLCRVRVTYGGGISAALATVRFSPPKRGGGALFKSLGSKLAALPQRKGLSSAHLLQALPMPGQTAEQKIRGQDATADAVVLIGGYDAAAVTSVVRDELGELNNRVEGLYRPAYSLGSRDKPASR
jgi:hypothetical protein